MVMVLAAGVAAADTGGSMGGGDWSSRITETRSCANALVAKNSSRAILRMEGKW